MHPRLPLTLAAAALTAALAACAAPTAPAPSSSAPTTPGAGATPSSATPRAGATSSSATPSATGVSQEHNAADVMFSQMMIPHHQGALEMSALAPERAGSPQVKELAARIQAAQQPEIDQMTSWLKAWGEPTGMPHAGHDMPGMDMDGMSQAEVMAKLKTLSGKEFDRQFLTSMIAHHQGALTMSENHARAAKNPQVLALTRAIVDSQTKEIAEMKEMLASL